MAKLFVFSVFLHNFSYLQYLWHSLHFIKEQISTWKHKFNGILYRNVKRRSLLAMLLKNCSISTVIKVYFSTWHPRCSRQGGTNSWLRLHWTQTWLVVQRRCLQKCQWRRESRKFKNHRSTILGFGCGSFDVRRKGTSALQHVKLSTHKCSLKKKTVIGWRQSSWK